MINNTPTLSAALYARISTTNQGQDLELQFSEMRKYIERQGWVLYKEYKDESTGKNIERGGFKLLMEDARLKRFDVVVVWKLDRFSRSLRDFVASIQFLNSYKVRFISLTQNIDTDESSPTAKLLIHILGAFAEFESGMISERVRAGIANAHKKGVKFGRKKKIFDVYRLVDLIEKKRLSIRQAAGEMGIKHGVAWLRYKEFREREKKMEKKSENETN
jgi:DNA invertase Pin-like site-specific DNA recombinase